MINVEKNGHTRQSSRRIQDSIILYTKLLTHDSFKPKDYWEG